MIKNKEHRFKSGEDSKSPKDRTPEIILSRSSSRQFFCMLKFGKHSQSLFCVCLILFTCFPQGLLSVNSMQSLGSVNQQLRKSNPLNLMRIDVVFAKIFNLYQLFKTSSKSKASINHQYPGLQVYLTHILSSSFVGVGMFVRSERRECFCLLKGWISNFISQRKQSPLTTDSDILLNPNLQNKFWEICSQVDLRLR